MLALITTTMLAMKGVIKALISGGIRNKVKVMVGDALLDEKFAKESVYEVLEVLAYASIEVSKV